MEHRLNTIQFESGSIGHKKKLVQGVLKAGRYFD